jgi:uncharacterized membrane protein
MLNKRKLQVIKRLGNVIAGAPSSPSLMGDATDGSDGSSRDSDFQDGGQGFDFMRHEFGFGSFMP